MIYFSPTVNALNAHIADLKERLAASEQERQALQDRLFTKHRMEPVTEQPRQQVLANPRVIAPPWAGFEEVANAEKQVWMMEEMNYLMNNAGLDEMRARAEAERRYVEQNTVSLV